LARQAGNGNAGAHGAAKTCRVSLIVEPHTITSGESVGVFGQLLCLSGSTEGQAVSVFERTGGSATFTNIGTPSTVAGGFYSLVVPSVTSDARFYVKARGVRSSNVGVKVAPVVTLVGPPEGTTLLTGFGGRVAFTGTTSPADNGATVLLQREATTNVEEWHNIQQGTVVGSTYSLTHAFAFPGDANLRVVIRPAGPFTVRGISNTLSYGISQKENPRLTIHTTAYTIHYGSPITISGVLAAGAGQTVSLVLHTVGKAPLAAVSTTTLGGGAYKFVEEPKVNTVYQVTGGGRKSALLFEGVKYNLTAGVSAKTVQSDQPLTFSGTVTPAVVGKTVYLERENRFGGGYHVVDVGTVTLGGTYSITHTIIGVGKEVYRVRVPGDPTNQSTASAPFTIEVTTAPPATLKPVAQPKEPH
jgi:hypothetical protein